MIKDLVGEQLGKTSRRVLLMSSLEPNFANTIASALSSQKHRDTLAVRLTTEGDPHLGDTKKLLNLPLLADALNHPLSEVLHATSFCIRFARIEGYLDILLGAYLRFFLRHNLRHLRSRALPNPKAPCGKSSHLVRPKERAQQDTVQRVYVVQYQGVERWMLP